MSAWWNNLFLLSSVCFTSPMERAFDLQYFLNTQTLRFCFFKQKHSQVTRLPDLVIFFNDFWKWSYGRFSLLWLIGNFSCCILWYTWQPVLKCPEGKILQNEVNFATKKNVENLHVRLFFEFECLNMLDIADCDRTNGSGFLHNR